MDNTGNSFHRRPQRRDGCRLVRCIGVLLIAVLVPSSASAAVPDFITFSGRLSDGTGWGMSATADLSFTLYNAEIGGTALWNQSFSSAVLDDGYFNVTLGDGTDPQTSLPLVVTAIFEQNDEVWIAVSIDSGPDLEPRRQIGSVPYAVRAGVAEEASVRLRDFVNSAAAIAMCSALRPATGTAVAVRFTESGRDGNYFCQNNGSPNSKCWHQVYASGGYSIGAYLNTNGCTYTPTSGFEQWFACCDDP